MKASRREASVFAGLALVASLSVAQTTYYVDPDWGGTESGTQGEPWTSVSSGWATINSDLASQAVTVYVSAREAGSDTAETLAERLDLDRTDTSANVLTIDGNDFYNTDDATPSWSAYAGSNRATYDPSGGSEALDTNNISGSPKRWNITVSGHKFIGTTKIAEICNIDGLTLEDNEFMREDAGAGGGPGVHLGPNGCTNTGVDWPDNIIIRSNIFHDVYGECLYVNGHKTEATEGNPSSDDVLIEDNEFYNCGSRGGEGDGVDVKDGVTNLIIRGNHFHDSDNGSGVAIVLDSGGLVEDNLIYNYGGGAAISLATIEATLTNRTNATIRNNIIVQNGGRGIAIRGPGTDQDNWLNLTIAHNTLVGNGDTGIIIDPDSLTEPTVNLYGNIIYDNDGGAFQLVATASGEILAHTDNLYWETGGATTFIQIEGDNKDAAATAAWEASAVVADPDLVNESGSADTDYKLNAASPCIGIASPVAGFTDDYFGVTRGAAWDCGAAEFGGGATITNAVLSGVVLGLLWVGRMWL